MVVQRVLRTLFITRDRAFVFKSWAAREGKVEDNKHTIGSRCEHNDRYAYPTLARRLRFDYNRTVIIDKHLKQTVICTKP